MAAHQTSLSLGISRQEHWSGLPLRSPFLFTAKYFTVQTGATSSWLTDTFLSPFPLSTRLTAYTNTLDEDVFLFLLYVLSWGCSSVHTHTNESHIPISKSHSSLSVVSLCLWSCRNSPTAFSAASGTGKNEKSLLWGRHLTFGPTARIQMR